MSLSDVQNIVLVLSGKGGVGKSSITTQLALSLSLAGHSVGVLDIDLTGPSIPRFFGIEEEKIRQAPEGWIPVRVHDGQLLADQEAETANGDSQGSQKIGALYAMSLAFLLASRSTAIVWRGPKKTAMIRQFLSDVAWPTLDYLLIDTPPGTSDEHISVVETLLKTVSSINGIPSSIPPTAGSSMAQPALAGAVLVTTPQAISTSDVRKEINFCAKTAVPIIGVVENMSGYICPCCGESTNLFSSGGGQIMAGEFGIPFLGAVPVDPLWGALVEEGRRPVYVAEEHSAEDEHSRGTGGAAEVDHGESIANQMSNVQSGSSIKKHADALLVNKYRDCMLYPLFKSIAATVVSTVQNKSAVLVDPDTSNISRS